MTEDQKQKAVLKDLKATFSTEAGKRTLFNMMLEEGFFSTTQVAGDSHTSAWREGRRSLVVDILRNLKVKPEQIAQQFEQEQE